MNFDNLFPDEREKGNTPSRQSQLVMLRMLKIMDYLCAKHKIDYFLVGGCLLGAIRHKAFIPWDDDLDVGMTRDNYEKFIKYAVPELPHDIFFQNADTDPFYSQNNNVEARLRDKYSSYTHLNGEKNKWHEGLQVDIFVYDCAFLPHQFFIIAQNYLLLKLFHNKNKRAKVLKFISRFCPFPLAYASSHFQFFNELRHSPTHILKKELSKLIRTKFEDMEVSIAQGWDSCLKRQFGDYMQLPPAESRTSPHRVLTNPFTPCDHSEILHWQSRNDKRMAKVFSPAPKSILTNTNLD
ncbi:MAG: LicD family protein [Bacteroidota bacterium]|nr:LicD family protein [Flavisolibacter sp.]MDQ3843117.1 LicD family protein [Bacteroidota bacterium]